VWGLPKDISEKRTVFRKKFVELWAFGAISPPMQVSLASQVQTPYRNQALSSMTLALLSLSLNYHIKKIYCHLP
jgi:hypothetical protein